MDVHSWFLEGEAEYFREVVRQFFESQNASGQTRMIIEGHDHLPAPTWPGLITELGVGELLAPESPSEVTANLGALAGLSFEAGRSAVGVPLLSGTIAAGVLRYLGVEDDLSSLLAGEIYAVRKIDRGMAGGLAVDRSGDAWAFSGLLEDTPDLLFASTLLLFCAEEDGTHSIVKIDENDLRGRLSASEAWVGAASASVELTGLTGRFLGSISDELMTPIQNDARFLQSCMRLGGATACLAMSCEHAKTREQFGQPIGHFQGVQYPLVDLYVQLQVMQAQLACYLQDRGSLLDQNLMTLSALNLAVRSDALFKRAAALTIDVHGGMGYTWEHDAHLFFRMAYSGSQHVSDAISDQDLMLGRLKDGIYVE